MAKNTPSHDASLGYVVGIGLCTRDHLFRVSAIPGTGARSEVIDYTIQGGGMVSTALVTLQRLGAMTRLISIVGGDPEGIAIRGELEAEGVDVSSVLVERGAQSRTILVLVDGHTGDRNFLPRPETTRPLVLGDLDPQVIAGARALHVDDADEVSLAAARWACESGVPVILDGTWRHERLPDLLPLLHAAIVGECFASEWLPGALPENVAQQLVEAGATVGVVTLGERGGVAAHKNGTQLTWPVFGVDAVDTTGAGDAFHGGYIYGLLQGWGLEERLRFAAAVGALNCRLLGGRTGLPIRSEVDRFLTQ